MSITRALSPIGLGLLLGVVAFIIFGPLLNLALWAFAEQWFYPNRLPTGWGFSFWERVFRPRAGAWTSLFNTVLVAFSAVILSMALAIPAGYALARQALPARNVIMLFFLLPQAFPNLPIFVNIAAIFYQWGLNGTLIGVVLVHSLPGLVYAVWIRDRRILYGGPLAGRSRPQPGRLSAAYVCRYHPAPGATWPACRVHLRIPRQH